MDLDDISGYYSKKIMDFGCTAKGVDWNSEEGQKIRFKQLLKIVDSDDHFSINDFGCGYGALYDYMCNENLNFQYFGNDISSEMVKEAKKKITDDKANLVVSNKPFGIADYTVASGIFNVSLDIEKKMWKNYIFDTINSLNDHSLKGFSFNCLTSYSDEDKKRDYLYYSDPCEVFDYCKKNFSRNVSLLHDYSLYEFTILVRKI